MRGSRHPPAPTKKTSVENTLVFCFIRYLKFHPQGWIRTAAATSLKTAQKQPSATATSAASGRNREELLGQRPAGCECRPRHEADAGSRNPCSFLAARLANPQLSHNCLSQWGDDRVELFVICSFPIGHAGGFEPKNRGTPHAGHASVFLMFLFCYLTLPCAPAAAGTNRTRCSARRPPAWKWGPPGRSWSGWRSAGCS